MLILSMPFIFLKTLVARLSAASDRIQTELLSGRIYKTTYACVLSLFSAGTTHGKSGCLFAVSRIRALTLPGAQHHLAIFLRDYLGIGLLTAVSTLVLTDLILHVRRYRRLGRESKRRRDFEGLLGEITSRLAHLPSERTTTEIRQGLDRLRLCLSVERVSFFARLENSNEFYLVSSSHASQLAPPTSRLTAATFPWAINQLLRGGPVLVKRVDHLPEPAASEKRFLEGLGAKSFLAVPIASERSVVGVLTLVERKRFRGWPDALVHQLPILGGIFYQAHMRQMIESKAYDVEQRFSLAVDNAPVMIWISDTSRLCTYFNYGWLTFTGRSLEEELGDGWLTGIHPADLQRCITTYSEAFDGRQKFKLEFRLRRFDGEYRWIVDYGLPRHEPNGRFCGYIGSCVDVTEARQSEQELKELSSRLIDAQEKERQRIARELHDDFSQQLTLLALELAKLNVRGNREVGVEAVVLTLEARIRRLAMALNSRAHQLHSSHLETLGLASAIQGFCRDFSNQYDIAVDFKQNGVPSDLPSNISLCLFRIVQEGLQNIAKHSRTRNCWIELGCDTGDMLLRIADSGVGFDPANARCGTGIGMISMRERLRLVNGNIRVLSSPAKGTRLEIRVPIGKISASA